MNFVKLIEDTTEILLLNQQQNGYALEQPWESNSLDKSKVTSLSVILDSDPSLHISKVNKTPFFHLETFPGRVHFKLSRMLKNGFMRSSQVELTVAMHS